MCHLNLLFKTCAQRVYNFFTLHFLEDNRSNRAGGQRNMNKWFNKTEQEVQKISQTQHPQAKTTSCKIILNKHRSVV